MTLSTLGSTLAIVAICACTHPTRLASLGVTDAGSDAGQAAARNADAADRHLITASAMGHVRLSMTLREAQRALPAASFSRASDGDGAALVAISFGKDDSVVVWADEDDPATPIDWSKKIVTIETFSAAFHTVEGVHPGSLVTDAVTFFGPVRDIVESEIEGRQYVTFARGPKGLTFRVDYTRIFDPGVRHTTYFAPNAKIWSIAISSLR